MTIMQRYMLRRLLLTAGAILFILAIVGVVMEGAVLFAMLSFGALQIGPLVVGLLALLPEQIYGIAPLAIGIANVHAYYEWQKHNELVALQTAGTSNFALALPGLLVAVIGLLVSAVNSVYLLPLAYGSFEDIRYNANNLVIPAALDTGYLQQVGPGLSISFRQRVDARTVEGVTILDGRTNGTFTYIFANSGSFMTDRGKNLEYVLVLHRGYYYRRDANQARPTPITFEELIVPITSDSPKKRQWRGWYESGIAGLLDPPPDVRARSSEEYGGRIAEGTARLVLPLLCLGYGAFTIGVMLRSRQSRTINPSLRVTLALVLVAAWHALVSAYSSLIVAHPAIAPLQFLLALIPAAVGIALIVIPPKPTRGTAADAAAWRKAAMPLGAGMNSG
jgi:lipopolysaccharide export system permease protein